MEAQAEPPHIEICPDVGQKFRGYKFVGPYCQKNYETLMKMPDVKKALQVMKVFKQNMPEIDAILLRSSCMHPMHLSVSCLGRHEKRACLRKHA